MTITTICATCGNAQQWTNREPPARCVMGDCNGELVTKARITSEHISSPLPLTVAMRRAQEVK